VIASIDECDIATHRLGPIADKEGGYGAHIVNVNKLVLGRFFRGLVQKFVKAINP
jgi:hypothetical protein